MELLGENRKRDDNRDVGMWRNRRDMRASVIDMGWLMKWECPCSHGTHGAMLV